MRCVVAGAAGLVLAGLPLVAAAEEVEFTVDDPAVTESSGLARDTTAGLYWTVNDSGDTARALAVDPSGEVQGEVSFVADVVDLEALARTPDGLYVADIGDNGAEREIVTVYRLIDPTPGSTSTYNAWDLQYADGEAHDAEAIAFTPDGRLLVITKEAQGGVWAAPASPTGQSVNTLERVGDAPAWVTDATVLDDGRIAVRGYLSVSVLDPTDFSVVASAALPLQPQGESLTQSLDGEALLVGSEGEGSEVLRVPVPDGVTDGLDEASAPPPTDAPAPTEEPEEPAPSEAQPSEEAAPEAEEAEGTAGTAGGRTGTFVAVALAALLALAGGAVVFLVGRPRGGERTPPSAGEDQAPAPAAAAAAPMVAGGEGSRTDAGETTTVSQPAVEPDAEPTPRPDPRASEAGPPAVGDAPAAPATDARTGADDYVLTEESARRVTWSEPEDAVEEARPRRAREQAEDLAWLYEER